MDDMIQIFLSEYPGFEYKVDDDTVILEGKISLNHEHEGIRFVNDYLVQIKFDKDGFSVGPTIYELSNKIDKSYPHLYGDKSLCLAAYPELYIFFSELSDDILVKWIDMFVIPYFYSYEYFKKYKSYPFGERSHGVKGILEYYQDYFDVETITQAFNLVKYVLISSRYRGHIQCPCESGKKIRNCHGEKVIAIMNNSLERDLLITVGNMYLKERNNV